eukprot:1139515-Pelagomonas_calceolata.AAC.6
MRRAGIFETSKLHSRVCEGMCSLRDFRPASLCATLFVQESSTAQQGLRWEQDERSDRVTFGQWMRAEPHPLSVESACASQALDTHAHTVHTHTHTRTQTHCPITLFR